MEGNYISKYSENSTQFKDRDCLIDALVKMGFNRDKIEVHEKPQELRDWHGNRTKYLDGVNYDAAEIVIRKSHVNQVMKSGASNDFGFKKNANGTYSAIISEYDSGYFTKKWLTETKVNYAEQGIIKQGAKQGLRYMGTKMVDGKRRVQFVQG